MAGRSKEETVAAGRLDGEDDEAVAVSKNGRKEAAAAAKRQVRSSS